MVLKELLSFNWREPGSGKRPELIMNAYRNVADLEVLRMYSTIIDLSVQKESVSVRVNYRLVRVIST